MEENAEYCTGQGFKVCFVASYYRLWKCQQCGYESSRPLSDETPTFPAYHPQPVATMHIAISDGQKARLKAILRMSDEAKARGSDRPIWEYMDIVSPLEED